MKKKVLFVITKANWGGAQRYVFDLATNLPKDEFDVAVVYGTPGLLAEKLKQAGTMLYRSEFLGRDISISKDIRSFFELLKLFKKLRPDIVHLNSSKAGGVGALAARIAGVPKIIFTSHGLAWDEDRNFLSRFFIYVASEITFLLCHTVITISKDNHRRVEKSKLIYNGLPPAPLLSRIEARSTLELPPEGLVVGAIGELTRNKGMHYLVEAAALLKTPCTICIIGSGEEKGELEKKIAKKRLPVRLVGFVPEAAKFLSAFDIFVMPSVKEGLPYVAIEAGQAGLPIVASRIPGIVDVVGGAGLLVAKKDAAALAGALEILLNDSALRQTLGEKLHERVSKEFSLEQMLQKTAALYTS